MIIKAEEAAALARDVMRTKDGYHNVLFSIFQAIRRAANGGLPCIFIWIDSYDLEQVKSSLSDYEITVNIDKESLTYVANHKISWEHLI